MTAKNDTMARYEQFTNARTAYRTFVWMCVAILIATNALSATGGYWFYHWQLEHRAREAVEQMQDALRGLR